MKRVDDVYPLSPLQEGILFQCLSAPGSGEYVEQVVWTSRGEFLHPAFAKAWREAVERHPVLRTAFFWERLERPHQVVRRQVQVPWEQLDWSAVPPAARDGRLASFLDADCRRGFVLTQAPLVRLTCILLGAEVRQFVFTYHHLLLDAWSVSLVLQEVSACYEAFRRGETPRLPDRRPYRDYIAWLQSQDTTDAEAYWRETLEGAAGVPPARDVLRPAQDGGVAGARYATFHHEWTSRDSMSARARTLGVTVNAIVHAAWALVLARHRDSRDVMVGTVVSGRTVPLPGIESMIGLHINTLPLRVPIDPCEPVAAVVERTHRRHVELRRFEHVPLKAIQRWTRAASLAFDSLVVFDQQREAPAAPVEIVHSRARTGHPLVLDAYAADGLSVSLTCDTHVHRRTDAARALQHFAVVLEQIVSDPHIPVDALVPLTRPERHQILVEWNDTAQERPRCRTLHGLVEEQAARTPDAVAVVAGDARLTYRDVNERANQVAHALVALGIGRNAAVGLSAVRTPAMIPNLLGILKAGAAWLPIDPEHPAARRRFTIDDAGIVALVCDRRDAGEWSDCGVPLLAFDGTEDRRGDGARNPAREILEDEGAYLLYTSGSTGQPKGVLNTHRGIVNKVLAMQRLYQLTSDDAVLQKTPLGFDVSVWEVCWPLLAGARVVLARPGAHRDPEYVAEAIVRHGVTIAHFVPSMLRAFLDTPGASRCRTLRDVISSGEALPPDLERKFFATLPARLHNLYGPTEAAIDVTSWACRRDDASTPVPIGRPIANVRAYVVGSGWQPMAIGAAGELCIAGDGLARGYPARTGLTARQFCPDPFSGPPGERLYRTGDRARYRHDGAIEFLGRLDDQIKVHGVRIEPGEIEAGLRAHPDVVDAAVALDAQSRLVAYVVPRDPREPSRDPLHAWLAARLPMAMRPATFVFVRSLPLNANGKLDRALLPGLTPLHAGRDEDADAPATAAEKTLASIWSRLLVADRVGVRDRLLELGGDSIVALRVVAAAADAGLRVSLRDVFERPLGEVAASASSCAEAPAAAEPSGEFPLAPVQRTFFEEQRADPHHFNQSIVLRILRPLPPPALARAAARLQDRHAALRLRFRQQHGRWIQSYAPPSVSVPFTYLDLSELSDAGRESAVAELQASLDLQKGPIWRLVQREDGHVHVIVHHLAVDIVSWSLLVEDLCRAAAAEERLGSPDSASYRDWALALARAAESGRTTRERAFWLDQLAGPVARVPRDVPAGANVEGCARTIHVELLPDETRALARLRRPVEPVLLAALAHALANEARPEAESILIDLESHGRGPEPDVPDVSRTVGWFTAIFPLRLPCSPRLALVSSLEEIERRRLAVPYSGQGYGVLRARDAVPPSPAEILFNYAGAAGALEAGAALAVTDRPAGPLRSPRAARRYLLEINGGIVDGRLRVAWTFSGQVHREGRIESLARSMAEALRTLVAASLDADVGAGRPAAGAGGADRSDAGISAREIARLAESLARARSATSG